MKSFFGGSKSQPSAPRKPAPDDRDIQKRKRHEEEDEDDQSVGRWNSNNEEAEGETEEQEDERPGKSDGARGNGQRRNEKSRPSMPGSMAARKAMEHLAQLTGQMPESISGLTATDDGWKVTLDVVELERIPRTTDVMASYEVELDGQGELAGYRRLTRYYRNQVDPK